jgi:L-iditol 2-dehydrogenase
MIDVAIERPHRVGIRDERVPGRPAPRQALVEVHRIGLCGSDYRLFDGTYSGPKRYPIRFGHEWSGRIVDLPAKSKLDRNAWVTGDCSKWCGDCNLCRLDKNLCRGIEKFGITVDGFSTQYRMVEEKYLYQDEFGLEPRLLALAEFFAVAFRGVMYAERELENADEALVLGAGPIGLATYLILKYHYGVNRVRISDPNQGKVAAARTSLDVPEFTHDLLEQPDEQTSTYEDMQRLARYPVVFECAGCAPAVNRALSVVGKGGTVICLGITPPSAIRTDLLVTKGVRLQGSIGGTGAFPEAMKFIAANARVAGGMVTHEFPVQRTQEAFEHTMDCEQRIKVQLVLQDLGGQVRMQHRGPRLTQQEH